MEWLDRCLGWKEYILLSSTELLLGSQDPSQMAHNRLQHWLQGFRCHLPASLGLCTTFPTYILIKNKILKSFRKFSFCFPYFGKHCFLFLYKSQNFSLFIVFLFKLWDEVICQGKSRTVEWMWWFFKIIYKYIIRIFKENLTKGKNHDSITNSNIIRELHASWNSPHWPLDARLSPSLQDGWVGSFKIREPKTL